MMLKLLLTVCLLVSALSENADVSSTVCSSCIDNLCYAVPTDIEDSLELMYITSIPAFDVTENILYFSTELYSNYIKIDKDMSKSFPQDVPGVSYFVKGYTVDQKTRQVYIWTRHNDTVYRYDPVTNTTDELEVTSEAIKEMHFKEKLYYTLKFRNGIFEYHNGMSNSILALESYNVTQFIVDKLEDVYATTESGVHRLKKDAAQVTLFTDKKYSVSVDKDERMYFLDPVLKKVLKLDYSSDRIVDAGVIDSNATDRIIFDKYNNILYTHREIFDVEEASWVFIPIRGQCRMDGTSFYFVGNSSGSLFYFSKTFIFLILSLFLTMRPSAI